MVNEEQWEREERDLEERLEHGEIDVVQYNTEQRQLARAYRDAAIEDAQDAYDERLNDWGMR